MGQRRHEVESLYPFGDKLTRIFGIQEEDVKEQEWQEELRDTQGLLHEKEKAFEQTEELRKKCIDLEMKIAKLCKGQWINGQKVEIEDKFGKIASEFFCVGCRNWGHSLDGCPEADISRSDDEEEPLGNYDGSSLGGVGFALQVESSSHGPS